MTYLFKLARRISAARLGLVLTLTAASACSKGDQIDYIGPNPNQILPVIQTLRVEPQITAAQVGKEIQFTATAYTATGSSVPVTVDWLATGGNILPDGKFIGDTTGTFTVRAQVRGQQAIADSAKVTVWKNATQIVDVIVFPDSAIVQPGETVQADAVLRLGDGTLAPNAAVTWSTNGGSIDDQGNFVSSTPGIFTITAQALNGLHGKATVLVRSGQRTLRSLSISPNVTEVEPGQTTAFVGIANWSDGSVASPDLVWSSTGGSVSSDGVYTAAGSGGNFMVMARQRQGTITDTAHVNVVAPTIAQISISPGSAALEPGARQTFSALAQLSDGSWQGSQVSWQATGGSINPAGHYVAGTVSGTFAVIATASGASVADTVVVTIGTTSATVVAVHVNPSSTQVPVGALRQFSTTVDWSDGSNLQPQISWTATGGSITPNGLFTAGTVPGAYSVIASSGGKADTSAVTVIAPVLAQMDLTPGTSSVQVSQTVQFTVTGTLSNGAPTTPAVDWTVAGGTMSPSGLFTAGTSAGTYRIIAAAQGVALADTSFVTVVVPAPALTSLIVTPASRAMAPGESGEFSIIGTWSDGTTGVPAVTWSYTGGTMVGNRFTAGSLPGNFIVVAKEVGGAHADTSAVTITSLASLTSLTVAPNPATLVVGVTRQYSVSATWSNGTTTLPPLTWTATGGTITSTGRYTAGSTPGSFRVYARQIGGSLVDSTDVTVVAGTPPTATLVSITITPNPVSLIPAATKQFSATAVWSDGTTKLPSLTWTETGGSISAAGLYTAGSKTGTFRVIAAGLGVADTAAVTISTAPAPTLSTLVISPGSTALQTGKSQQFVVSGQYSNGSTGAVSVTWSSTGGTVTSGGMYTAGSNPGSFRLIAKQIGGTKADTSSITLSSAALPPPPPPSGGWYANEPGGMTFLNERGFNAKIENSWSDRGDPYFSIVQDPTAPRSAGSVGQAQFTPSLCFGCGPIQTATHIEQYAKRTIYVAFWVKFSSNWVGNASAVNKIFHIHINNGNKVYLSAQGIGNGKLNAEIHFQSLGMYDNGNHPISWNGMPNIDAAGNTAANLTRGVWHKWELVLVANTPGVYDGQAHWWIDGTKVGQYSNIGFSSASQTGLLNIWQIVNWNPTYGGGGPAVPADQYMWMDHVYISGR